MDAVTSAVLTASRLLVAISARSLTADQRTGLVSALRAFTEAGGEPCDVFSVGWD